MSKALQTVSSEGHWTPDQIKLITDVVAKNATPDELKLFLYRCQNMGLDPLKPGQIHFIKYSPNSPGTIVVGIEGFRARAQRTGKFAGIKRGELKDDKGKLIGAWAEVYRHDWKEPAREEVPLNEYTTGKGPWQKMPSTMIKKVAEAAALRMAFPDELGGIYTNEEMDQATPVVGNSYVVPETPSITDGVQEEGFVIKYGKLAKQYVHKADPVSLRDLILEIETHYAKNGKPMSDYHKALIKEAEPFVAAYENQKTEE